MFPRLASSKSGSRGAVRASCDATPPEAQAQFLGKQDLHREGLPILGAGMRISRSVLAFLAAFILCLSSTAGMPDIPNTSYDESESLPYEDASLPINDLVVIHGRTGELAPRSPASSGGSLGTGLKLNFLVHKKRAGGIICRSLIILDHSLRC